MPPDTCTIALSSKRVTPRLVIPPRGRVSTRYAFPRAETPRSIDTPANKGTDIDEIKTKIGTKKA